mgnify:CR=1 FL=1
MSLNPVLTQHLVQVAQAATAAAAGGKQAIYGAACAELGISLRKLYYRLAQYQKMGVTIPCAFFLKSDVLVPNNPSSTPL